MARSSDLTLWKLPRRMALLVSSAKSRSTWLIQDEYVGVKCRWKRGRLASQRITRGVLCVA